MKPGEFDELIRQKFDQNDFAYSPGNWNKLAEELDGRAKKRSMIMWLWMPAAGMAASVALAMGVTTLLRFGAPADKGTNNEYTQTSRFISRQPAQAAIAMIADEAAITEQAATPAPAGSRLAKIYGSKSIKPVGSDDDNSIGIKLSNVLAAQPGNKKPVSEPVNLAMVEAAAAKNVPAVKAKKPVIEKPGYNTFAEEQLAAVKPPVKFSIILSGGINQGNHNSGYAAGATVRRMLNDKVYVEGDIAFASSDNTQRTQYMSYDNGAPASGLGGTGIAAKSGPAAKLSKVESSGAVAATPAPEGTLKTTDISYNLYYAQVTPSIGYKILKKMSIGLGPDFQKMLVDNRPPVSTVDRGNIQVAPSFDVGFMGKTEYALTKKVKAAVYYRKGINGFITLTDKYIDRDYLQFQVKCTIFNK